MKTTFYDEPGLNGNSAQFDYGSYNTSQITALIASIQSINIPPRVKVTLYGLDGFIGPTHVISNTGRKPLKVTCFSNVFAQTVGSVKIECACNISVNSEIVYEIIKYDFQRTVNKVIGYTFYKVSPEPLKDPLDTASPFNPTVLIIPDFGTERQIYECVQERFAQKRISSLILDIRGVGDSYASSAVQYAEIIQDYRFIAKQLGQYEKKPIVMGHGFGGAIAQLWALTYKLELSRLLLIDTAPFATYSTYNLANTQISQWLANSITQQQLALYLATFTYNIPGEECHNDKLALDLATGIEEADTTTLKLFITQNPDIPSLAAAPKYILIPVFIMHGLNDVYVDISGGDTLASLINNSVYRKIGTGHSPHLTAPIRAFESIMQYLSPSGAVYFV